jgi:hypothetical protein
MLEARYTIINQWNNHEVFEKTQEFETIHELEDFLAYNRSYITKISFTGKIVKAVA